MKRATESDFALALISCDRLIPRRRSYVSRPWLDTYLPTAIGWAAFLLKVWIVLKCLLT